MHIFAKQMEGFALDFPAAFASPSRCIPWVCGPGGHPLVQVDSLFFVCEASAAWKWYNHLENAFAPKPLLRINVDESSICLHQSGGKGTVFAPRDTTQRVNQTKKRQSFTLVSFVCDQFELQAIMPQVVICNERTLPARMENRVRKSLPPRMQLIRKVSAWNDSITFARIVRDLGNRLKDHRAHLQPVLLLDSCKLHLHRKLWHAYAAAGIAVVIIPPLTTFLLQPLDSDPYGFNMLKSLLQKECQDKIVRSGSAVIDFENMLLCLWRAVGDSLDKRHWSDVFDRLGFGKKQERIGNAIKRLLPMGALAPMGNARPALEELKLCFPRRAVIDERLVWKLFDNPRPALIHPRPRESENDLSVLVLPNGAKRSGLPRQFTEIVERRKRARKTQ